MNADLSRLPWSRKPVILGLPTVGVEPAPIEAKVGPRAEGFFGQLRPPFSESCRDATRPTTVSKVSTCGSSLPSALPSVRC
jgi:hypothetical protein